MSAPASLITDILPRGPGRLLDLGGGRESARGAFEGLGYQYVSVDLESQASGVPRVIADAHHLPLRSDSFDVVVSKDTLEHFCNPREAVAEVRRVLRPGGHFAIWVPFLHGFHSTDYYRYTPLGLRYLLADFEVEMLDSPRGVVSANGTLAEAALRRLGAERLGALVRSVANRIDGVITAHLRQPSSVAAGYRVLARKPGDTSRCARRRDASA
ncbi:MAG: class I SAM-dependent methyltransferase [Myxococcales bacterium]|nr:class I SAM-dependent methyltransferase [Myxococcales bacterium]